MNTKKLGDIVIFPITWLIILYIEIQQTLKFHSLRDGPWFTFHLILTMLIILLGFFAVVKMLNLKVKIQPGLIVKGMVYKDNKVYMVIGRIKADPNPDIENLFYFARIDKINYKWLISKLEENREYTNPIAVCKIGFPHCDIYNIKMEAW